MIVLAAYIRTNGISVHLKYFSILLVYFHSNMRDFLSFPFVLNKTNFSPPKAWQCSFDVSHFCPDEDVEGSLHGKLGVFKYIFSLFYSMCDR